jgi:serine/threonine protein kinase
LTPEYLDEPDSENYRQNFTRISKIENRIKSSEKEKRKAVGTYIYMAPEMLEEHNYGEKVDIWSLGIIFYMLLSVSHPLQYLSDFVGKSDIKDAILSTLESETPECLINYDSDYLIGLNPEALQLLKSMLEIDPEQRASADFIMHTQTLFESEYKKYVTKGLDETQRSVSLADHVKKAFVPKYEFNLESLLDRVSSDQINTLKKIIYYTFSEALTDKEESDELSTLFNSLDISDNSSIDQDNVEMIYSVYAEGHPVNDEDIDEDTIEHLKEIMGSQEEYSIDEFIKSVVVFKQLMHPSEQK